MLQPVKRRSITPDWLPAGWTLEIKTQTEGANIGRQITCYYDPRSRSRFYSEEEVFQHLKGLTADEPTAGNQFYSTNKVEDTKIDLNTNPCSTNEENISNSLATASTSQTENTNTSLNTNVLVDHAPDGLPPGWITQTKFRMSKRMSKRMLKSIIKKDTIYIDPVAGYKFRSLKSALSYIKPGDISKCTFKPIKIEGKVTSKSEPHPQTSITSLTEPGSTVQRCLFSEEIANVKVCGEISRSLVKEQPSAQDKITGPANVELLLQENVDLSAEKIKLDGHSTMKPQAKKHKSDKKFSLKQSKTIRAITKPVRVSKRLAALRTDGLTESGVADTISTPNNHLNPNSFQAPKGLAALRTDGLSELGVANTISTPNKKSNPNSFQNINHRSNLPMSLEETLDITSVGSESKLLQSVNNDLVEEMKSEVTTNGQSQSSNPCREHQSRSKRNKFIKATTLPVRASKRLAALRSDIPAKCEFVDHSGYDMSMPSNQLEAKSDNCLDSSVIENKNVTKVSDRNTESPPKIVSAGLESIEHIQPVNDDLSVGKVKFRKETRSLGKAKLVEQTTLGLNCDEQTPSKKLKRVHPQGSKKDVSIEEVTKGQLVAKGLAKSKAEVLSDNRSTCNMEHISNVIQSKCPVADGRFKETSEPSVLKAADRFKEQSKPTASIVRFKESSNVPVATEKCEESSKFLLPTEKFKEEKIKLVANLEHREEPERNEPRGKEVSQDHGEVGRPGNHQPEYLFKSLFGDSWTADPCLEFAFKTLTSDIPEDYFQLQPDLTSGPNACSAPYTNSKPKTLEQNEPLSHIGLWDDLWSFGRNDMQSTKKNG